MLTGVTRPFHAPHALFAPSMAPVEAADTIRWHLREHHHIEISRATRIYRIVKRA